RSLSIVQVTRPEPAGGVVVVVAVVVVAVVVVAVVVVVGAAVVVDCANPGRARNTDSNARHRPSRRASMRSSLPAPRLPAGGRKVTPPGNATAREGESPAVARNRRK